MKAWSWIILAAVGILTVPELARAEVIQGEIVKIDAQKQSFDIARSDPATNAAEPEAARVFTRPETRFEGMAGLEDLRLGDEVWADVVADNKGVLQAEIVRIDKVNIREGGIVQPAGPESRQEAPADPDA